MAISSGRLAGYGAARPGIGVGSGDGSEARQGSKPKERNLVPGAEEIKQLLLLMDTDKSGKISRQEYMNFMAAEFDRLDKDKSGELDVKELAQSQLRVSHPAIGK